MLKGNVINKGLSTVFGTREKSRFLVWQIIVIIGLALMLDLIDILLEFVFGIGLIVDSITGAIDFILFRIFLWYKGVNRTGVYTIMGILELIPAINALPLQTPAIIITIIIHNKEVDLAEDNERREIAQQKAQIDILNKTIKSLAADDFSFNGLLSKMFKRTPQ